MSDHLPTLRMADVLGKASEMVRDNPHLGSEQFSIVLAEARRELRQDTIVRGIDGPEQSKGTSADILAVWRGCIGALPEFSHDRRPSALEIAELVRALAARLAGKDQAPLAANALALATVAARAEADEGSVLAVSNRLLSEH